MSGHFSAETLAFLAQAPFQEKSWLQANKPLYHEHVAGPQRALMEALAPFMAGLDPNLEGSASRIYRDMRFGTGPALRGNLWVVFQERNLEPLERPAFFFELYPDRYRYGMGFYSASRSKMEGIRRRMDAAPERFAALVAALPPAAQLMGEAYRQSRSAHLPEPLRPWYDKKSLWVQTECPIDDLVVSAGLAQALQREWAPLLPLYRFLRAA